MLSSAEVTKHLVHHQNSCYIVTYTSPYAHNITVIPVKTVQTNLPLSLSLPSSSLTTPVTSQFNKRLGPMCWKSAFAIGPLTTPRLHRNNNLFMSEMSQNRSLGGPQGPYFWLEALSGNIEVRSEIFPEASNKNSWPCFETYSKKISDPNFLWQSKNCAF